MSPIRVGIIGLSSAPAAHMAWKWAETAHLPSIMKHSGFELVALCNSSLAAAQEAKEIHHLDASVKTYGSPEEIATDPDVDLVIVVVDVRKHYSLARPALLAGKDVFIEWPFTSTVAEADELTKLAKEKGVSGMVGAQARADPILKKIKALVDGGSIGDITSSTVVANYGNPLGKVDAWVAAWDQWLHMDGSTSFSTGLGHCKSTLCHAEALKFQEKKMGVLILSEFSIASRMSSAIYLT